MIITVTLNPAIDRTYEIKEFQVGSVNRAEATRTDIGGKGINVSKVVHIISGNTIACGFLSGRNGRYIKDSLTSIGIHHDFVEVPGETRINIKIVSEDGQHTDINEQGFNVSEIDFNRLLDHLGAYMRRGNVFVVSGSIPPNLDAELYKKLCQAVTDAKLPLIVDADGRRLNWALSAKPVFIKPNAEELSQATGIEITDIPSAVRGAKMMMEAGAGAVCVSMGARGAVCVNAEQSLFVEPPIVPVRGPVGAGDAMVAAIAIAVEENMSFESTAKYAVAAGTASVLSFGVGFPSKRALIEVYEKVKISEI